MKKRKDIPAKHELAGDRAADFDANFGTERDIFGRNLYLLYPWLNAPQPQTRQAEDIANTEPDSGPDERLRVVLDAIDALREIVEPRIAHLDVACYFDWSGDNDWAEDTSVKPSLTRWALVRDVSPEVVHWQVNVSADSPDENTEEIPNFATVDVPELSRDALAVWVEAALKQECPYSLTETDGETGEAAFCKPSWNALEITGSRARLVENTHWENRSNFGVHDDDLNLVYGVPIERDASGLWVSEDADRFPLAQPVQIVFDSRYGISTLELRVRVPWERWLSEAYPEGVALRSILHRLLERGWQVDPASPETLT